MEEHAHVCCTYHFPTEPAPGIDTVHDLLLYAAKTHGSKKGFASRDIIKVITEEKEVTKRVGGKEHKEMKKWNYFKLSPYNWMTYEGFLDKVKEIGAGLRVLAADDGRESEKFFNIYSQTS